VYPTASRAENRIARRPALGHPTWIAGWERAGAGRRVETGPRRSTLTLPGRFRGGQVFLDENERDRHRNTVMAAGCGPRKKKRHLKTRPAGAACPGACAGSSNARGARTAARHQPAPHSEGVRELAPGPALPGPRSHRDRLLRGAGAPDGGDLRNSAKRDPGDCGMIRLGTGPAGASRTMLAGTTADVPAAGEARVAGRAPTGPSQGGRERAVGPAFPAV